MSIHYKFKNALNVDTVTFDGLHISVGDLKKSITQQKQLGNFTDFDLKITNAQTKEEYTDEAHLIPKNTSLIIARIPLAHVSKKTWEQHSFQQSVSKVLPKVEKKVILDLSKMNGSEEEKIQAMMLQSSADYDPKGYQRIRGQTQTGDVPTSYRCNKCKKGGHWIKNCPYIGKDQIDVKRTTGIPKSFREKDENSLPESNVVVNLGCTDKNEAVPEDLICNICKDIFTDAVMIPCCGSSFCDDCVRTSLLESEDNECPDCKEKGSSPGSLIPNRFLRNSVNTFKNETGYKRMEKRTIAKAIVSPPINSPSVDELPTPADSNEVEQQEQTQNNTPKILPEKCEDQNGAGGNSETQCTTTADIESDYEDNITVTVPIALRENQAYKARPPDDSNSRKLMPPGLEQSASSEAVSRNYHAHSPKSEEITSGGNVEVVQSGQNKHISPHVYNSNIPIHNVMPRDILPVNIVPGNRGHDMYPRHPYNHIPYQGQLVRGPPMNYNRMPQAPCNNYFPQPSYNTHSGYHMPENPAIRPVTPSINLASVYQGVAAKVGSGVIDDPLEAFNRIMREKEREREHQRSPNRRRSTSVDKNPRGRLSPQMLRRNRLRTSPYNHKDDRIIDSKPRDRRGYSREREKISERNRWRDLRKSRRNSRSRSRSIPTTRKILPNLSRRKYSRSKSPVVGMRVHQSINPRNVRRSSDVRSKSPVHNFNQGRNIGRSFPYARPKINVNYENDKFRDNYRGHTSELHSIKERHKIGDEHREMYDISPPGTSEPPPPGFDNTITDLIATNQHNTEQERAHMPDIYEKYVSKDFGDRKMYRRDLLSDRSPRSRSSKISSDDLPRQSRSRSVSKERYIKTDPISSKKPNLLESNSRAPKDYESQVAKRRRNSDDIDLKHDKAFVRDGSTTLKNSKNETLPSNRKESVDEEVNLVKKKEQKRFDKKEQKVDKKIKERKKKKKYKDEKDRKKQKKKEKLSEREDDVMENSYNVEVMDAENSEHTPYNSNNDKIKCEESQDLKRGKETDLAHKRSESKIEYSESKIENIHSDSILDIQSYETDFDEFQHYGVSRTSTLPLPALSKWEREDQVISSASFKEESDGGFNTKPSGSKCDKVTEEVLRRAENAIFSRDNKSRHADISNVCSDREKSYNLEKCSKDNAERVQITIPISSRAQRSIEIMENKPINISLSPVIKKSVKDRLGSKVVKTKFELQNKAEPKQNVHRERSRDRRERSRDCVKERSTERSKEHSQGRPKDFPRNRSKDRRRPSNNERPLNRNENDKYRKSEKRNEKSYQTSGEKSASSCSSNSEIDSDDVKQNKKRKHKKEKKRKKHSSSSDLADGSKKKHNKSKKKYKTSKKNKNKI